jgi:hypothetical protein
MYRDPGRIALLAEILVEKHGVLGARAVAARRTRLWSDPDDHEVADFWRAVGEAVALRLAQTRQTLPEVLNGVVMTRQKAVRRSGDSI